jgi:hypothetical protein
MYAVPVEFVHNPPSWLLLERLEYWKEGLGNWEQAYKICLSVLL